MRLDAGIDYVFLDTGADPEKALVLLFPSKSLSRIRTPACIGVPRTTNASESRTRWKRTRAPLRMASVSAAGLKCSGTMMFLPRQLVLASCSSKCMLHRSILKQVISRCILGKSPLRVTSPSSGLVQRKPIPSGYLCREDQHRVTLLSRSSVESLPANQLTNRGS